MPGELHKGPLEGGAYAFDEDTLRGLIKDWYELGDSYDHSIVNAEAMTQVEGPGADPASLLFAKAANASGKSYLETLLVNRDFCYEQAELFKKALNDYLALEQGGAAEFDKHGQGETTGGVF